ncbi:MAG: hypothetical protein V5B31_02690 [Candidatus Accumulibacter propinquus]|jgi:hypothetical protein|uniref:hypothetical protein n=1 Tax=Candidatus Accumulibacter propinquus TaxID=2954380 RepID=UPI002FC316C2
MGDDENIAVKVVYAVHPVGQIFNIPCVPGLINAVASLAEVDVCFLGVKNITSPAGQFNPGVKVVWYPITQHARHERFATLAIGYLLFGISCLCKRRPQYILAIGLRGLIVGGLLAAMFRAKLVYNCLEIYPARATSGFLGSIAHRIEAYLNSRAVATVIQDEQRSTLLAKINGLHRHRFVYFPNYPLVSGETLDPIEVELFKISRGIPVDKRIILYSGGLYPGVGLERMLTGLEQLADDWLVVLQSHDGVLQLDRVVVDSMVAAGRLYVLQRPLEARAYELLVEGCDVGLAWYSTSDENMKYVGLSSGKVGAYWSKGKPIIINRIPFFDVVCDEYNAGVAIHSIDDVFEGIRVIASDYQKYSLGASFCYKKYFDAEKGLKELQGVFV